jgi:hypothetical protein
MSALFLPTHAEVSAGDVLVLKPCATNLRVLLIYHQLDVRNMSRKLNRCTDSRDAGTNVDDFQRSWLIDGPFGDNWISILLACTSIRYRAHLGTFSRFQMRLRRELCRRTSSLNCSGRVEGDGPAPINIVGSCWSYRPHLDLHCAPKVRQGSAFA